MRRAALALALFALATPAAAELRGHGGPVRAIAVAPDGRQAVSGGFDQSAIVWDLAGGAALAVLRFHDGAVNAVAALADGRFATGGEDGRIALWRLGEPAPVRVIAAHAGPIASLVVSPDGTAIASASWDETVRVTPLAGGESRVLAGHQGNVNAVAFRRDGAPVSAGYDGTVRIWSDPPRIVRLPAPVAALAVPTDDSIIAAGADGVVRSLAPDGSIGREFVAETAPVTALALSPDGALVAVAPIRGRIELVERASGRAMRQLGSVEQVTWSLAFLPNGSALLSGGGDRAIHRWDVATGAEIGARPAVATAALDPSDRGAVVFRACEACHTLTADAGNRAGPTLHGVFGRRIATAPGYNYSPALTRLDIVWNADTIAKLFELGPATFTPGTTMPEQTIVDPADRAALVECLAKATR